MSAARQERSMPVSQATAWGHLPDGRPLHRWTLRNAGGAQVEISDLGGTLLSWQTPDRQGRMGEVLLGHADARQYLDSNAYMGAIMGRWANRIRGGRFRLDGIDYRVDRNDGGNHLHGGNDGFHRQRWDVEPDDGGLTLRLVSPEGDGGFPGEVRVELRLRLEDDGSLDLRYAATSDAPTPLSLTAHPYFNLNDRRPDIRDHVIRIDADAFLAIDAGAIPVGRQGVAGTAFDFREAAPIGSRLHWPDPQLRLVGGFDHCYVPRGEASARQRRCPSDRSRGCASSGTSGASRSRSARQLPADTLKSESAAAHSSATVAAYRRSAGSCGTSPTTFTNCAGFVRCGSSPAAAAVPERGGRMPTRVFSKVDLPAPLRPISATTSPALILSDTPRSAVTLP
jgi:aldose 1-epimerase